MNLFFVLHILDQWAGLRTSCQFCSSRQKVFIRLILLVINKYLLQWKYFFLDQRTNLGTS